MAYMYESIATENTSDTVMHHDYKLPWSHWRNANSWQAWTNSFQLMRWGSLRSFFEIIWTLELFSTVWMLLIINKLEIKSKYKLIKQLSPPHYIKKQNPQKRLVLDSVSLSLFSILLLWKWVSGTWCGSKEKKLNCSFTNYLHISC